MYEKHPYFSISHHGNKIWRYFDFPKFVSLLDKESLFFVRVSKLPDPWEGAYPRLNFDKDFLKKVFQDFAASNRNAVVPSDEDLLKFIESSKQTSQISRRHFAVNCWHMNNSDSEAFWKIYSHFETGVAIESDVQSLISSFETYKKRNVYIGDVNYYSEDSFISAANGFSPIISKRDSFKYESELRAVIWELEHDPRFPKPGDFEMKSGEYVKVELNKLIKKIHVAPLAPEWFYELVCSVIRRYGFVFECSKSPLYSSPVTGLD